MALTRSALDTGNKMVRSVCPNGVGVGGGSLLLLFVAVANLRPLTPPTTLGAGEPLYM